MTSTPVVLATTNGTGMGHLSRQTAVGLALAEAAGAAGAARPGSRPDPLLLSMSAALPLVAGALGRRFPGGLRTEYCPSYQRQWMPLPDWHRYLTDRLDALLAETGARALVFDGVAPYAGLLRARAAHPEVAFVWCRRGMWRPGANRRALRATPYFDLVIEPGDLASGADRGPSAGLRALRVDPVTLAAHVPVLPRAEAAAALGLDPDRPTALVSVSALAPRGGVSPMTAAVRALLADPAWQVAVTNDVDEPGAEGRLVRLRDVYPLVAYLSAFDTAVAAAGYNAVHELLPAGVPTLLVPDGKVVTDDQPTRARAVAARGLALLAEDTEGIAVGVRQLLDPGMRAALTSACRDLPPQHGSAQAAAAVADLAAAHVRHRASGIELRRLVNLGARRTAARLLGPWGRAAARRVLKRAPAPSLERPLSVHLVEDDEQDDRLGPPELPRRIVSAADPLPCLLTERLDSALLRAGPPVEHLLPAASEAYRARRREIVTHYYDVRPRPGS